MQISILENLPIEESKKFMPIESEEWKWSFKDYPKEKIELFRKRKKPRD